jgi:hypothetical protein
MPHSARKEKGIVRAPCCNSTANSTFCQGYLEPRKGINTKTGWDAAVYAVFGFLDLILQHCPAAVTNTTNLGLGMINTMKPGIAKKIAE